MNPDSENSRPAKPANSSADNASDDLLARGECLLERLTREAEAARAEARRVELQLALADARRGNQEQLQAWMARHDANYSRDTIAHPATTMPAPASVVMETNAVNDAVIDNTAIDNKANERTAITEPSALAPSSHVRIDPWSSYLPAAKQRLAARAQRLTAGASVQEVIDIPIQTLLAPQTTEHTVAHRRRLGDQRLRADIALGKLSEAKQDPAKSANKADLEKLKPETVTRSKPSKLDRQAIAKLAKTVESGEAEQHQLSLRQRLFRGASGISLSIILHVLLVIVLAALTIKLPAPPASLTFETSVNSTSETFELSEQMDVTEPETMSESAQVPEMAVDLSQDLSQLSSSMSESLAQSLPSPMGLASAALAATSGGSGQSNPMKTNASFFGAAASGNCFCYVIDSSNSMKGGAWEAAKGELLRSLASLKSNQRFYIIFFNQELSAITMPGEREPAARALYAESVNIEHAKQWIDTIRIAKGAPPGDALEFAIDLEPDAIYFLTDGVTTFDLTKFLREKNRIDDFISGEQVKVPIHAISYYSLDGQELMQKVASENNGQYIYVPDPSKY